MILYYAGLASAPENVCEFAFENIPDLRVLVSYAYPNHLQQAIKHGFKKIFLDCGAYTAMTKGIRIDVHEYIQFCKDLPKEVEVIAGLDVIGDGEKTRRNWDIMRDAGVDAIPIYHWGVEPAFLEYYASQTDFIAIGGITGSIRGAALPFLSPIFLKYPNHRFHGFGINAPEVVMAFPFYSSDATTWRAGSRFGDIMLPSGKRFKAGRKIASIDHLQVREEIKELTGLNIDDEDFHPAELDKYNMKVLYDLLVTQHNKINFSDRVEQQYIF